MAPQGSQWNDTRYSRIRKKLVDDIRKLVAALVEATRSNPVSLDTAAFQHLAAKVDQFDGCLKLILFSDDAVCTY